MDLQWLFCVLVLAGAHQTSGHYQTSEGHDDVTVCPDDYSPRDGCVTLDQLLSGNLIKSNTTFKFVPATFKVKQGIVVRFENVSNITIESAGSHKANISCVGENSGFIVNEVKGLAVKNMQFAGCGAVMMHYIKSMLLLKDSSDIVLQNLTFKHGKGAGVYAANIHGNFTTLNTVFTHMQGPSLFIDEYSDDDKLDQNSTILISNTQIDSSKGNVGIGINSMFPVTIRITDVTIVNGTQRTGIDIVSSSLLPVHMVITLENYNYSNNHVHLLTPSDQWLPYGLGFSFMSGEGSVTIEIIDSYFINNDYYYMDNTYKFFFFSSILNFGYFNTSSNITVRNTTISNNTGQFDTAVFVYQDYKMVTVEMINSNITNNVINASSFYNTYGAVIMRDIDNVLIHNCCFVNNSFSGLLIQNSNIHFEGVNVIQGNKGYNGGGMALYDSDLYLSENATIFFEDNMAENMGGGLYVKVTNFIELCFLHEYGTSMLIFSSNSAETAGNDWYGGYLDTCLIDNYFGSEVASYISYSYDNYTIDMTSDPWHVCDCSTKSNLDCTNVARTIQTVETYPGKLFNLSLIAVGQLLAITTMSGVPTAIYAGLLNLPINPNPGAIPDPFLVQTGERTCSNLSYRINTTNLNEVMVLALDDNIIKIPEYFIDIWQQDPSELEWNEILRNILSSDSTVPAYVEINLLPCPPGFELSNGECNCSKHLRDFVTSCSIDTMLIKRKHPIWLNRSQDYFEQENITLYLTHKHCPFDYCNSEDFFSLDDPDAQCSHNRSGVLCGECKPGYSLTLGVMECRQCTNIYLLLLIPFVFAGILLVVWLSVADMTVTGGTINGLLFFANVVRENQVTFFPSQAAKGFLSVFIAWLNLDFGLNTCFYDGLDSYAFTWLQLSFPVFVWLLAFSIIIASRHVAFVNKVCGRNIVHVLATLFLLSYAKLQRTMITSLSFTVINVSNGASYFVWLVDGNVRYLQGKHIPLFLFNILFLMIVFIPYTLSVMLGPWLQRKTQYRVLGWVLKLKPFFDAYFGPLKDKHRYWTGVLLVSRVILSLISTVNVFGDDSINLVAILVLIQILLGVLWQSGGVYKVWAFSVLDMFYLVNLSILSVFTLYNKLSGGNQYATVCVSVGSAFAIFLLTLLYHCLKKLASYKHFPCIFRHRPQPLLERGYGSEDSDDEMLDVLDRGRASFKSDQKNDASIKINNPQVCYQDTY